MASSPPLYSTEQGAATAPLYGEQTSGSWQSQPPPGQGAGPWQTQPPPGQGAGQWQTQPPPGQGAGQWQTQPPPGQGAGAGHAFRHDDPSGPGNGVPVYGHLAIPATTYPYTQQLDARTLNAEYRDSSRLAAMCGRPTHRVLVMMWDELFWVLSLPLLLATTLLLSATRFLLEAVLRPLLVGPIQLLGDHVLKPLSVVQFDALLLPGITLAANTVTALLLVVRPLGQLLDVLVRPLATLLSSCRLVHITYGAPPALTKTDGAQHV